MTTSTATEVATKLSRRSSPRDNFSYPRLSRHGSNESRSSDGSVPGMTDTSDSEISFDEDGIYNTSAGELWDSFWPDSTTSSIPRQSQEYHPGLLHSRQYSNDFEIDIDPLKRQHPFDAHGDAAKITTKDQSSEVDLFMAQSRAFQSSPSQCTPKKSPVAYSVYPKIPVMGMQRYPHPPRTSSLSFEPPAPPRRPLFPSRNPSAALQSCEPGHNINSVFIAPSLALNGETTSQQQSSITVKTAVSVPVSPAYPPPPPPRPLRPTTSAFHLGDIIQAHQSQNTTTTTNNNNKESVSHNVMAPPAPLLPSPLPEPLPVRPQPERFVSVFEFDSDSETEADDEGTSFAKRIARGLHKKSGSPKRGAAQRKGLTTRFASLDADASRKDLTEGLRNDSSLSRKRGGSLGRIFGLMGR
ncbi:hypothetical protein FHL15_005127 [Xylaria flabelliformis]|uniref:Uncharacterized protein n=1 Tax=Xylaria flabelliformis TaxID=2512241 RepID=A0A553I1H5_9PEZI|nr:hypothetical protein FHL15_005127 [Xylaria flabelliformis]